MMGTPTDLCHSLAQHPNHEWMEGWMDGRMDEWMTGVNFIIQSSDGNPKGLSLILWPTSIEDFIPLIYGRMTCHKINHPKT